MLTFEEFKRIDLRVATILDAKPHPNADRLVLLKIDLGEEQRQIVAGIKDFYPTDVLIGKQIVVVVNLEPATIRGESSQGMLLAAKDGAQSNLTLISTDASIEAGSKVG